MRDGRQGSGEGEGGGRWEREISIRNFGVGEGYGETHRTSIVRASKDARRARSFSRAGESSGIVGPPLAVDDVVLVDDDM